MKIQWDSVQWGRHRGPIAVEGLGYQYYFIWAPNWLPRWRRHFWIQRFWYDGPHVVFGFWFFNVGWSTQWSLPPFEFLSTNDRIKWFLKPSWYRKLWDMEEYQPDATHDG
jgi:hypothetical protein